MKYDILMVDPPWPKRKGGLRKTRPNQTKNLDYLTLSVADIFRLLDKNIFTQVALPHAVFLWNIDQFILDGDIAMKDRGYRRHAILIWDKGNGVAPCFTVRYSHEYLIWYYKPTFLPIDIDQRGKYTTVIRESAREHSRKPESGYRFIEDIYPDTKRLDVFSRELRPGWNQFGNQQNYFGVAK